MLSAKSLFQEIIDNDESFQLFCSIAASGEAQGGWENGRIAALVAPGMRDLAPKITRHGADEDKHGRIFNALLKKRGLEPVPVPPETDYTMLLEQRGIGLAHDKLRRDEPLSEQDIVVYLSHSRVTEQRAADQMDMLVKYFGDHPELGKAIHMIDHDESNHLAYCHEELLRLNYAGHGRLIHGVLRECALTEIRVYRDVSLAVMSHMGRILRWPRAKAAALTAGIHGMYAYERAAGWHRMVDLKMPERRDALGGPAAPAPAF
ncbi:ferritin-like domain-containing protein [Streptomyces sp. NPDC085481]|uniref:ferritin-like domain-containing protein n=1 Tax=Streptomyces sp. NPDC085481 TaxID=3365727 RepID=UPI0037D941EB